MYRWCNYKGTWRVAQVSGETYSFHGFLSQFSTDDVPEDLWGPIIHPPSNREKYDLAEVLDDNNLEVKNAVDEEEEHKLKGERYICPKFTVTPTRSNDCGIVALANVLGISYSEAKMKCFHAGWSSSNGIGIGFLELIVEDYGFISCFRKSLSLGHVWDFSAKGTFFVHCDRHVMPARNSKVFNQVKTNQLILEVWEVRKNLNLVLDK